MYRRMSMIQYAALAVGIVFMAAWVESVHAEVLQKEAYLDMSTSHVFSLRKLLLGRVDLVLLEDMTLDSLIRAEVDHGDVKTVNRLAPALDVPEISGEMYMAFSLKTPDETVDRCRAALATLKKNGEWARIASTYNQLN